MQARERRVLVREAGRLQRPVGIRALSDGVDEADVEQSRRRHGEQREERESDQPRSEHRVPQEVVVAATVDVERHRDAQDHGPVAPDVHPVGGGHDGVAPEPRALQPLLPVDPEPSLEGEEQVGVPEGGIGASGSQVPDAEVEEHRGNDQNRLTSQPFAAGQTFAFRRSGRIERPALRSARQHRYDLLGRVSRERRPMASVNSLTRATGSHAARVVGESLVVGS